MMNKFIKRGVLGLLTVALLLPSLTLSPVSAAKQDMAMELFSWKAASPCEKNMETVKDNLIPGPSRTYTHYIQNLTVHGKDGVTSGWIFYYLRDRCSYKLNEANYGLPRQVMGTKDREVKATEDLQLQFNEFKPIKTRGAEAINLRMTYAFSPDLTDYNMVGLDKFEVLVSKDGKTWLDGGAGIRSWELIGHAKDNTANRDVFVYSIESQNFFDIDGLNPGDTIADIMIRPKGDHYWAGGWFAFSDVTVNAFETLSDWETAVPDGRSDLLQLGEEKMRDIVVDRATKISDLAWTSDVTIFTDAVSGTDYHGEGGTIVKEFVAGLPFRGPMYSRAVKTNYEFLISEAVKDGVYVGGRTTGACAGMDCTNYAFDAYTLVSRTYSFRLWAAQSDNAKVLLGDIKKAPSTTFTNLDIVNINDAQTIYEGYALLKPGDIMTTYTTTGAIHHRLVRDEVRVTRNADGTIDPEKSYIPIAEQTDAMWYLFETPDGTQIWQNLSTRTKLEAYMQNYPHYKLLFGTNSPKLDFTFKELRDGYYVPWTLKEYLSGAVENVDVQAIMHPTDYKDITNGFTGVLASDYKMVKYGVKLEDLDRGTVLFEDEQYTRVLGVQNSETVLYTNQTLDAHLAQLTDGNYRISMYAQAGPVTQVGAMRPITTKTMDFTVDKGAAAEVTVTPSASSVTKGETVTVAVNSSVAAQAADVKLKFDSQLLSYVDGTADAGLASVTCTGNIVHIVSGDATSGKPVATLTFTAKQDIAKMSDAVKVLSASIVPAGSDTAVKASGENTCVSAFFTDVDTNAWYHDAVDYALENSIMGGYNATTFGPNDTLTRAMVVQVLYNKEGQPTITGSHKFPDVKSGDWFNNAVTWANINKVVGGYGDGRFGPNDKVTLEQIAVILWNYSGNPTPTGNAASLGAHSDWAANALSWAAAKGIFKNVPYETVVGTATRAQTAQMLMNYLKK